MNKLYRSSTDKVFAGVCGGLGEYLNIDSSVIRILWAISVFIFGFGVLLYIISAIVIPLEPRDKVEKKAKSQSPQALSILFPFLIGLFLILVGISALGYTLDWRFFHWHEIRHLLWIIFPALFIILGLALIFRTILFEKKDTQILPDPDASVSHSRREPEMKKTSTKRADTGAYSKPTKDSKKEKAGGETASQKTVPRRLYRNTNNRMISGVCAGLADYVDLDVSIIRLIWILFTIMSAGFGGVILYFILVLVIPPNPE
jgi:phage shock protein C